MQDYERVLDTGGTGAWLLNSNGLGREYVRTHVPGVMGQTVIQVVRLILGAGARTVVRYANGDTLDLRRSNLLWERGKAKRSDEALALRAVNIRAERQPSAEATQ